MKRTPLLVAFLAFTSFMGAQAQTVLDHFSGTQVSETTWWSWGHQPAVSVANSLLTVNVPADTDVGMAANDAFRGDFDFVMDFANFMATGSGGDHSFGFGVLNASGFYDSINYVGLKITGDGSGSQFVSFGEKDGLGHGMAMAATTAMAGELRIRRHTVLNQKQIEALYRPAGQTTWTTLQTWPDFLTDLVYVEIHANSDPGGTVSAECDRITYNGVIISSPTSFGQGCHGLKARHWSLPHTGNNQFGVFVEGDPALANAPLATLLGFSQVSLPLWSIGAPGCTLLASPDMVWMAQPLDSEANGIGYIPIPPNSNLVGLDFHVQMIVVSPQNPASLVLSNRVDAKIMDL